MSQDGAMGDDEEEGRARYRELLEELRTVLPGVQVLFAFLLTAPFSQRFTELDEFGRDLYGVALTGTALTMFVFLSPASYHRIAPRRPRSTRLRTSIAVAVIGMMLLAVSVLTAVFAVMRFIFGAGVGTGVLVALTGIAIMLWYLLPLVARLRTNLGGARS